MKKLLSVVLVLVLVLSMSLVAFGLEVEINKEVIIMNEGTVHPAEEFNFTVGAGVVIDGNAASAPAFSPNVFTINVGQGGGSASSNITVPEYTAVGVYEYPINEVAGDTAGFIYDNQQYALRVTVINDGQGGFEPVLTLTDGNNVKRDAFENEFYAGSLVITKEITGNYAVFDDEFDVTVVLTPDEGKNIKEGPITLSGAVAGSGSVDKVGDNVEVTFKVTNESVVTIANIPYNVSYVVSEDPGEYDQDISGGQGVINQGVQEVEIVNTLDTEILTGINLDNVPYVLVLGAATVGLFGFTMKRRFNK